jgi:hypothetical protein
MYSPLMINTRGIVLAIASGPGCRSCAKTPRGEARAKALQADGEEFRREFKDALKAREKPSQ